MLSLKILGIWMRHYHVINGQIHTNFCRIFQEGHVSSGKVTKWETWETWENFTLPLGDVT